MCSVNLQDLCFKEHFFLMEPENKRHNKEKQQRKPLKDIQESTAKKNKGKVSGKESKLN